MSFVDSPVLLVAALALRRVRIRSGAMDEIPVIKPLRQDNLAQADISAILAASASVLMFILETVPSRDGDLPPTR